MLIRIFNIIFKYLRNQRKIDDDEMSRIYETLFYEKIFVIFCANVFLTNKYLMTVYYYLVYGRMSYNFLDGEVWLVVTLVIDIVHADL